MNVLLAGRVSSETSLPDWQMATFSLILHMVTLLSALSTSPSPLLIRTPVIFN